MSRKSRIRDAHLPHHIISRSIPELLLFKTNRDKEKYIELLKEASIEFQIEVLAYCLMDNHVHILLHPKGADISKIMRKINNTYAKYYNRTHSRRGHLFNERFKNKIIKNENYLLRASTYIHNNAKDIPEYSNKIEEYPYSSLKYYLGKKDTSELINTRIILRHLDKDYKKSIRAYSKLMQIQTKGLKDFFNKTEIEKHNNYRSERKYIKRDILAEDVLRAVAKVLYIEDYELLKVNNFLEFNKYRSISAVALRALCNMTRREVANVIGYISQSMVSVLTKKGIQEIKQNNELFNSILNTL
jgi:REP element-mobilizing transposase RayT